MTPKQAKIISEWWDSLDDIEKKIVKEFTSKRKISENFRR